MSGEGYMAHHWTCLCIWVKQWERVLSWCDLPVATHGRKLYRLTKVINKRFGLLGIPENSGETMVSMIQILQENFIFSNLIRERFYIFIQNFKILG
jgi:hypothetical protein